MSGTYASTMLTQLRALVRPPSPPRAAQLRWACGAALLALGMLLTWDWGQPPHRDVSPAATAPVETTGSAENRAAAIAPDLQLYRDVTAAVAHGENYYAAAKPQLLAHGFPIGSTFNWRLPTYAWFFASLPGPWAIQALVLLLLAAALVVQVVADERAVGLPAALVGGLLGLGVARWGADGLAYYTQELWAAGLIWLAVGLQRLGYARWAILCGVMALLFRELALPFVAGAAAVAFYRGRRGEAAGWLAGMGLFFAYLAWHAGQVQQALAAGASAVAGSTAPAASASQWLRLGGLDFVLLTARMNGLFFAAPGGVLCGYLLLGLWGYLSARDEASETPLLALGLYLAAFSIVGMPVNFYWGLLYAPLVPGGVARAAATLARCWEESVAADMGEAMEPAVTSSSVRCSEVRL